jgi:hypothetical protein
MGPLDVVVVEHADHVADELDDAVRLHRGRLVGVAEPAQVEGDRPVAGGRERRDLAAPQLVGVGPPVDQQHGRTAAGVLDVDADAVDVNERAGPAGGGGGRWSTALRGGVPYGRLTIPTVVGAVARAIGKAPTAWRAGVASSRERRSRDGPGD